MRLFVVIVLLLLCSGVASASSITLQPCGQDTINSALAQNQEVHLSSGEYSITGPIYVNSGNSLIGDPNTIIKVSSSSSQWFTDGNGFISTKETALHDITLSNFQINGNLRAFPQSWANSGSGVHNAGRAIDLRGSAGSFFKNININNLKIYDCYSDGIHIAFATNVNIYNNFISDCQHSGIFFVSVVGGLVENNQVFGITSDDLRYDNSVNNIFRNNLFYSYTGDSNGAYENGQHGVQISDEGFSHGGGSDKPTHTTNIEGYGNIFASGMLQDIAIDTTGKGVTNVYVHDNKGATVETSGTPVSDLSFVNNISFNNPPTLEQSENVFKSIFDILNIKFSSTAYISQYQQIQTLDNWQKKGKNTEATLSIDGFQNMSKIDGIEYIPVRAQDNAIVNYRTRNDAAFGAGQHSELSYQENNTTLTVLLTVYTSWYTGSSKSISIGGKRISSPSIKKESETEIFNVSAPAPKQFPKIDDIKAEVTYYNNSYNPHAILSLSNAWGIVQEEYSYNGSNMTHFKLAGEVTKKTNGLSYVNYSKVSMWKGSEGQISGYGNELYMKGHFKKEFLNIYVQTPYETVKIKEVNVTEVPDESSIILNPGLWGFVGTFGIFGWFIYRNFRRMVTRW